MNHNEPSRFASRNTSILKAPFLIRGQSEGTKKEF